MLAEGPKLATRPTQYRVGTTPVVAYRSARLTFRRAALESLPAHGVVLIDVVPRGEPADPYTVALTREDFEREFPNVVGSTSWQARGIYDCNSVPDRALAFVVRGRAPERRKGATATTPAAERDAGAASAAVIPTAAELAAAAWARAVARDAGVPAESAEHLALARAWAAPWRPERVRALLVVDALPEEHVGDVDTAVDLSPLSAEAVALLPRELPRRFCRTVYCLAFGEYALCAGVPWANHGAPMLWNAFAYLVDGPDRTAPLPGNSEFGPRLLWKLRTLHALRRLGVWLVPAAPSTAVLHLPSSGAVALYREAWTRFAPPLLGGGAPDGVWLWGSAPMRQALRGEVGAPCVDDAAAPEPQSLARLASFLRNELPRADS